MPRRMISTVVTVNFKKLPGLWLPEAVFRRHGATSDFDIFLELSQFIQNRFANYEKQ